MRISIGRPASSVAESNCCGADGSARSAPMARTSIPYLSRSFVARDSSRSTRRAVRTRFAPAAANCSAMARPIPALAPVTNAHLLCTCCRRNFDGCMMLLYCRRHRLLEFFADPAGEGFEALLASEELLHDVLSRKRAAGLKYSFPVFPCNRVFQQICPVELIEEVERDHLVIQIRVVIRRISRQMREAGVHAVAVDPCIRQEFRVIGLQQNVQIQRFRIEIMRIERITGVKELRPHPVCAPKGPGPVHFFHQFRRYRLAYLVMSGEGRQ